MQKIRIINSYGTILPQQFFESILTLNLIWGKIRGMTPEMQDSLPDTLPEYSVHHKAFDEIPTIPDNLPAEYAHIIGIDATVADGTLVYPSDQHPKGSVPVSSNSSEGRGRKIQAVFADKDLSPTQKLVALVRIAKRLPREREQRQTLLIDPNFPDPDIPLPK